LQSLATVDQIAFAFIDTDDSSGSHSSNKNFEAQLSWRWASASAAIAAASAENATLVNAEGWIDASVPGAIVARTASANDDEQWETVLTDFDWELVFRWKRTSYIAGSMLGGPSEATIEWEIGQDTLPGRYRFVYNGDAKDASGKITTFQGVTGPFEVV
jgi:neutral ceramidase